jgi:predicted Zn-dependent protease
MLRKIILSILLMGSLAACAVNPVTGKREITFVSESEEIKLGTENYAFMQQAGGGEFDIDPLLTEYVDGIGNRLADVSDRPLPYEFIVLNSSVPNAWALPGGKIAINRGLLTEIDSEAELAAVLGHEIVHAAARHSARQMERGTLLQVAVVGTAIATGNSGYSDLATGGASVGAQLISQSYGRNAELESDLYGMRYMSKAGYDPQGAVRLQETFVRLSEGHSSSDWLSGLFASHPPSQERVNANIQTATTLPVGGDVGTERFQAAMQKTLDTKPAYDAYEEGRKALSEDDEDLAVAKAQEAIEMFPDEANFYALRGDARYMSEAYDTAIDNYDIAIRRRDDFFQYYLQRGLANEKLAQDASAIADLEKSNNLFPTAVAHNALGNIATRQGRKSDAIEHYSVVASGQGEVASAALVSLVRLDLSDNPGNYLQARCFQSNDGNLGVSVTNRTPLSVTGVRLIVQFQTSAGSQRREFSVPGPIGSGLSTSVSTNIGPYTPEAGCPVEISTARVNE